MASFNSTLENIKTAAKNGAEKIDVEAIKEKAKKGTEIVTAKAVEVKDAVINTKNSIEEKLTELDRLLESTITEYNDKYTIMNDKGVRLFVERNRSEDTVDMVENLVNSIANKPKSFEADFEEINIARKQFKDSCKFAATELQAARTAAAGAGAGIAAGASVAFMAPSAAMWIATTFGTASTGTAISALSGAAATNAALAWLGGGALTAGGGGVAAGNALLALAGPIGWSIAGATLLSSIILFASKRTKLNKEKNAEIESVKENIERVKEMDAQINEILVETGRIRSCLNELYKECLPLYGKDYLGFSNEEKLLLGTLVNNTKALSAMFDKTIS